MACATRKRELDQNKMMERSRDRDTFNSRRLVSWHGGPCAVNSYNDIDDDDDDDD